MTVTAEPSNAEIGRRLDVVATAVDSGFREINLRLDKYVLVQVYDRDVAHMTSRYVALQEELAEMKRDRTAATRFVVAQVMAFLALVTSLTVGVLALLK